MSKSSNKPQNSPPLPLADAVRMLVERFGEPPRPPASKAFELLLWENAAYLVDDPRRDAVFANLAKRIGTTPSAILAAPRKAIEEAIKDGGMKPPMRAEKLLECARIAQELGEDLDMVLDRGGKEARKVLKRFPGMGDPGVDKVLALSGREAVLALDSNGLRVLLRLGYGDTKAAYAATYKSVRAAVDPEVPRKVEEAARVHLALRTHGREICRRSNPLCDQCPLQTQCPSAGTKGE